MSASFNMTATVRSDHGKADVRRLRSTGQVPGVVYGDDKEPASIKMVHDDLMHNLEQEAFYSHILSIDIDGKKEDVVLKDLQRHPARAIILHVDFQRVSTTKEMKMHVPLHFINEEESAGIKEGGALNRLMAEIEVSCLASVLPENIEVDISALNVGDSIRLSELTMPEGVTITALNRGEEYDQSVVAVHKTRVETEDDEATAASDDAEGGDASEESSED